MSDTNFQDPFRRIYELVPIAGWLMVCGVAFYLARERAFPLTLCFGVAGVALTLALVHLPAALELTHRRRGLRGQALSYITLRELADKMRRHPGMTWMGYGFQWSQEQAQMASLVTRKDPAKLVQADERKMGQPWIHGLGTIESDIWVPTKELGRHMIIVGTTGAGKTRAFDSQIAQPILRGEAVIIFDPKGDRDLYEATRATCQAVGRPEAFKYFHPAFPAQSVCLDPLKNFNRTTGLATRIATLIPSDSAADPWSAFAQSELNKDIQALLLVNEKPSLVQLRHLFETGLDQLVIAATETYFSQRMGASQSAAWRAEFENNFLKGNKKNDQEVAKAWVTYYREMCKRNKDFASTVMSGLHSSFMHDKTHFSKMITSLLPVLDMLTAGELGPLLSPVKGDSREITDFNRIINDRCVLYVGLDSLSDSIVASAIGSLLLADLVSLAGDRYNYGNDLGNVNVFLDEAAEIINPPFIQMLNKGRGALMRACIATQTFADVTARTGNEAKSRMVLGNINNTFAMQTIDGKTQEYITEAFPQTYLTSIERSQSNSAGSKADLHFGATTTERINQQEAPLFPPSLLGCLPVLEFFANVSGGRILKGRLPILLKDFDQPIPLVEDPA